MKCTLHTGRTTTDVDSRRIILSACTTRKAVLLGDTVISMFLMRVLTLPLISRIKSRMCTKLINRRRTLLRPPTRARDVHTRLIWRQTYLNVRTRVSLSRALRVIRVRARRVTWTIQRRRYINAEYRDDHHITARGAWYLRSISRLTTRNRIRVRPLRTQFHRLWRRIITTCGSIMSLPLLLHRHTTSKRHAHIIKTMIIRLATDVRR